MTAGLDRLELVDTLLDGKHRIDQVVAEGGFAVVYRGVQLRLSLPIAIKVLKTEVTSERHAELLSRFLEEARTTAKLQHPNIARVLDSGIAYPAKAPSGVPWIVLEWLEGETLAQRLERRRGDGGAAAEDVWRLMRPVVEAVAYAHARGVVHRDLKPSNILLVAEPEGTVAKILDFGIAKTVEEDTAAGSGSTQTQAGYTAFSPGYAAPEQISRTRTGPWTDVHALALIVTELLTDQPPYSGETKEELFGQICSSTRPTPARFGVHVGAWQGVLERAAALKPSDRMKNAGELLQALDAGLSVANTATELHSTPPPKKSRGLAVGISVAAALALAVVLGTRQTSPPVARTTPVAASSPSPLSTAAPSASTPPRTESGFVTVPAGFRVLVEGKARDPQDGGITLEGVLGSVHHVAIERGTRRAEVEVVLTARGAKPSAIDAPARARPVATPSAKSAAAQPPAAPSGHVGATTSFN